MEESGFETDVWKFLLSHLIVLDVGILEKSNVILILVLNIKPFFFFLSRGRLSQYGSHYP